MSISRKSEIMSEEKLNLLIRDISHEDCDDDALDIKIMNLKKLRKKSRLLSKDNIERLNERVSNLDKNDNWDQDVMSKEYEEIRRRDSVNESRPDFN